MVERNPLNRNGCNRSCRQQQTPGKNWQTPSSNSCKTPVGALKPSADLSWKSPYRDP